MAKYINDLKVLANRKISGDFYIIDLHQPDPFPNFLPGQFVQVRVDDSPGTFLRRPFSVYDADYSKNTLSLLYQIVGKGTEAMSSLAPGDVLNVVFPLGNSFTMPEKGENVLFIGGGVGIAPFLYFAKSIVNSGCRLTTLLGFRNKERIIQYNEFEKYGRTLVTTEDGSEGEKGFVTSHSVLAKEKFDRIYCCGPDPMMKAVAAYASSKGTWCEVSLENLMACGFGICLCCIAPTTRGNVCTCTEGPVFNIKDLKW